MRFDRLLRTALLGGLALATGCCHLTEALNDRVDHIADSEPCFDDWYNPQWDLTREYRPDGGHHWLLRRCCCECEGCE